MIASLYQSFIAGLSRRSVYAEADDVGDANLRVQPDVIPLAAPEIRLVREQIVRCDGGIERQLPLGERQLDVSVLHMKRIEVHDDENRIAAIGSALRVADELGVVRLVELESPVELQRGMFAADLVDAPDELRQTRRAVEVARLDLILLRVEIFLTAGLHRRVLT